MDLNEILEQHLAEAFKEARRIQTLPARMARQERVQAKRAEEAYRRRVAEAERLDEERREEARRRALAERRRVDPLFDAECRANEEAAARRAAQDEQRRKELEQAHKRYAKRLRDEDKRNKRIVAKWESGDRKGLTRADYEHANIRVHAAKVAASLPPLTEHQKAVIRQVLGAS